MQERNEFKITTFGPPEEDTRRDRLKDLFDAWPINPKEFFLNLGLFLPPQTLSRILFMHHLYSQILDVQGVVIEFGCRWGQNLSLFSSLRGIYEPYNRLRKIIGFDTFEGFIKVSDKDHQSLSQGDYAVAKDYQNYLERLLSLMEQESPLPHIKKFDIIKGNAPDMLAKYLQEHPETVVALAYFDMDLYEPTRDCLSIIRPYLTKGSVLGFDELNDSLCPGETVAVREIFGLGNLRIKRFPYNSRTSYTVIE